MRFFACLALIAFFSTANGLKCYICTSTSTELDESCVNDPESMTSESAIQDCNKKYCYSMRQEYVDPMGKVASIQRTCMDDPPYLNEVIEDSTFRTYFKACQVDLCNGGTGTDLSNSMSNTDNGRPITLFVPGIDSATTAYISITLLLLTQIVLLLG